MLALERAAREADFIGADLIMSQAQMAYSLQHLFDQLLDVYRTLGAPTYGGDRHWEVNYHANIGGYPAAAFGINSATVSFRQMRVAPVVIKPAGEAPDEADLRGQCHAGVYQQFVGPDHWPTGWMTSIIAPGVADVLSSIFDVTVSWSSAYVETISPSVVYKWDFFIGDDESAIATWVMEFFGPTDPVIADPYVPGSNLLWGYANVGALHWRQSAGSDQNRGGSDSSGGGGGSGSVDLTPVVDAVDRLKEAIDDISLNASVNHGEFEVSLRGADGGGSGGGP